MDSKKRHELEQNELAKWIASQYNDWIRPNSSWLGYAVLGVLIFITIIMVTEQFNTKNQNAAWRHYYAALHSENAETELETVANMGGAVGVQARLTLAQRQLAEGCSYAAVDKALTIVVLEKAIVSFEQVQKATNDPAVLRQAGYGLGQSRETLAAARVGNDQAMAEEEYQKVVDKWAESGIGKRAQNQLALIRQPGTKVFFQRTAEKKPEPTGQDSGLDDFRAKFGSGQDDPFSQDKQSLEQPLEEQPKTDEIKPEEK